MEGQEPLIALVERISEAPGPVRLPPQEVLDVCPKCGQEGSLGITYHLSLHLSEPCGQRYAEQAQANDWKFPEHLCIRCSKCRYGWSTQVRLKG